jgi:predicted helicase
MFLTLAGRKGVFDFDELGIHDVVELLNRANADAVKADFGNRTRNEDPVIHFYEHFLTAYDRQKKIQRGVFYTPQPVVSYIARSLHELLQKEFGIEDGLASTITWGEMLKKRPGIKLPKVRVPKTGKAEGEEVDLDPNEPFVMILDIATGTATFLVEVIEVIFQQLKATWDKGGASRMPAIPGTSARFRTLTDYWNAYVPNALLPRLYGYELMMAPYTIAHMKLALKFSEINARLGQSDTLFKFEGRAHIYLTNALEPASGFETQKFEDFFPALAHEAAAVNEVKRRKRFTVVIGNPPYSGISSNMTDYAQRIVDAYKFVDGGALNERKLWLQDDYVKFIRKAQTTIDSTTVGILGYITNHGYLDNPTFRGMRQSLMETFPQLRVLDLHGNANKKEQSPDGTEDKNVFDIRQGVAICLAARGGTNPAVAHANLWGSRETKYVWLAKHRASDTDFSPLTPDSPFYFFEPQNTDCRAEYDAGWKVTDIFPVNGVGVVMARDSMTVDFDAEALWKRVKDFVSLAPEKARTKYELGKDARDWRVATAQADVQASGPSKKKVCAILYRPFDGRFTYYTGNSRGFYASPCRKVMSNMAEGDNLGMALSRSVEIGQFEHVFCTKGIIGHHSVSLKEVNYLCPLWLVPTDDAPSSLLKEGGQRQPNLALPFLRALVTALYLKTTGKHGLPAGLTPEDIFHYAYAVFHSPGYRSRYAEFLKIDFPRLPLTGNLELFRALARLGGELTALHLLESPKLGKPITEFIGDGKKDVAKGYPDYVDKTVWINDNQGFKGVPEPVWNFHIGGYQVCQKWLKDRRGRTLSKTDITHYQTIVVALSETIRLMKEIDQVIEKHGGWPGAFTAAESKVTALNV